MSHRKGKKEKKEVEISLRRTPYHRNIYAIGSVPNMTELDVRLNFYADIQVDPEKNTPVFFNDTTIIMPIKSAKILMLTLQKLIFEYEKKHGEIEIDNTEDFRAEEA